MDFSTFKGSLSQSECPAQLNVHQQALWYAARGDWHKAHDLINDLSTTEASWVHAYLHRVEGDEWNAGYWYRRAEKEMPKISLDMEWEVIVKTLLYIV